MSDQTCMLWRGGTWTAERVELLKRRWAEGVSASRIAIELGGGLTRSAVLGKVHRLQLSPREVEERSPVKRSA